MRKNLIFINTLFVKGWKLIKDSLRPFNYSSIPFKIRSKKEIRFYKRTSDWLFKTVDWFFSLAAKSKCNIPGIIYLKKHVSKSNSAIVPN